MLLFTVALFACQWFYYFQMTGSLPASWLANAVEMVRQLFPWFLHCCCLICNRIHCLLSVHACCKVCSMHGPHMQFHSQGEEFVILLLRVAVLLLYSFYAFSINYRQHANKLDIKCGRKLLTVYSGRQLKV